MHEFVNACGQRLGRIRAGASFGRLRRADEQRDFPARRMRVERGGDFRELAANELFVELGHLARQACRPLTQNLARVGDAFGHAMRSFVENNGAVFDAKPFQCSPTFTAPSWQESYEKKLFGGQSRGGERSQ